MRTKNTLVKYFNAPSEYEDLLRADEQNKTATTVFPLLPSKTIFR